MASRGRGPGSARTPPTPRRRRRPPSRLSRRGHAVPRPRARYEEAAQTRGTSRLRCDETSGSARLLYRAQCVLERGVGKHGGAMTAAPAAGAERQGHHVVVVGGGFGGLQAVRRLRRERVEITLIE